MTIWSVFQNPVTYLHGFSKRAAFCGNNFKNNYGNNLRIIGEFKEFPERITGEFIKHNRLYG